MDIITKFVSSDDLYSYKCSGKLLNNSLIFNENNIKVIYDISNNILVRESDKYIITFTFYEEETSMCQFYDKELNKYIDIGIYTNKIINKDNYIEIEYKLIDDGKVITYLINYGG